MISRARDLTSSALGPEREMRGVAAGADLLRPDLAGDVEQHAAAVALAIHVAGAMEHALEGGERRRDRLVARGRVLLDGRVESAGVPVLDGLRGTPRPVPLR
jgi:hypothetical protein